MSAMEHHKTPNQPYDSSMQTSRSRLNIRSENLSELGTALKQKYGLASG